MNYISIDPETIEEIKHRVDIVDVISDYVVLRKRGQNFVGLCPFHDENTGSFTVNPTRQFYHCFGCGAGGNAIKFLMEMRKQSFTDVILDLSRRYQVEIKTLNPEQKQEIQRKLSLQEQLYEILAVASNFYQHALGQPQGEIALNYLIKQRQLKAETIQQFQLGYAPAGWETLYRYLVEQKRYPLALVEQAGLIKPRKSGSGYYDQFRDRLMIPIQDTQGRIIAFGSRTLGNDEPKYLNSPETPLFDKGKTLFALDKAIKSISQKDQVILVEGYFDAIALHAVGINQVVASLGTAFSQAQLKQLLRYTESKQVIFNFDADQAGIKATQRAINEITSLIYSGQVQLKILNLPDGKDADEFIRTNQEAVAKFQQLLVDAPLWFDWQIQQLIKEYDLKQADHFQRISQEMVKLLSQLENIHQRTYYVSYCAEILCQGNGSLMPVYVKNLQSQVKKTQLKSTIKQSNLLLHPASQNYQRVKIFNRLEEAEARLLQIYLHCPQNRLEIEEGLEARDLLFSLSPHRFLWQQILQIKENFEATGIDYDNSLVTKLEGQLLNFPEEMSQVKYLFYAHNQDILKENILSSSRISSQRYFQYFFPQDLARVSFDIQEALITLEWIKCSKRRSYFLEKLTQSKSPQEQEILLKELLITESRIRELDKQSTIDH